MELKKRSEFPENELWDLTALYQDQEDFLRAIEKTREEINEFVRNNNRMPDKDSDDPLEKRMGEALIYIRNKKAERMARG